MPTYCYTCENCRQVTMVACLIAERKESVKCDRCGMAARRDFALEQKQFKSAPGAWPRESVAAGVILRNAKKRKSTRGEWASQPNIRRMGIRG